MANRSMLFAVSALPQLGERPKQILALGEFGWDIPLVFKLLVSAETQPCASVVWEQDELIAVAGSLPLGLARLKAIRAELSTDAPAVNDIDAAIAWLDEPHVHQYPFFLMEPGEILDLSDTPFPQQIAALLAEIENLETPALIARARNAAPAEDWGPGAWSNILYYQPEGSTRAPIKRDEGHIFTTPRHLLENASTLPDCKNLYQIYLELEDDAAELPAALKALDTLPGPFKLDLSSIAGFTDGLPHGLPAELCSLTKLHGLVAGNLGLSQLPEGFENLTALEGLFLQNNQFTTFPEALRSLPHLQHLSIWDNPIGSLPDWIAGFTQLEGLLIGQCGLAELPDALWSLSALQSLDISKTPGLTQLSEKIGNLKALEELNVHGCSLTELPATLADLPHLREVFAGDNQLTALPRKLWRKRLDVLSVSGNTLKKPLLGARAKKLWI